MITQKKNTQVIPISNTKDSLKINLFHKFLFNSDNIDARLFQMPFYQSDELLLLPLSVKFLRGLKLLYSVSGYTLCTTL